MELYGKVLLIAIPAFVVLILIEAFYASYVKNEKIRVMDMISSLSSGMTNTIKDVIGLTIAIFTYEYLVNHIALFSWQTTAITFVVAFVLMDLTGYWIHRLQHVVNYFWNLHIVHHSSEEYNLPCALRQQFASITNLTSLITIIPCALIGIPFEVFAITAPIHLFAQFWYHTRHINKMGFLEKIIVTPSHHRVHHSMNDIYMDKNYSQIFIIWDKLFGTFQEELEEVKPVYGVRRPVSSWNPLWINFQHLWLIIKDCYRTNSWKDKARIWFMPTGWRPADVAEKYPIPYIKDMEELEKYDPQYSNSFTIWANLSLILVFLMVYHFFYAIGSFEKADYMTYGLFMVAYIFSFTSMMDKALIGLLASYAVSLWGIQIVLSSGTWFGLDQLISNSHLVLLGIWVLNIVSASYFYFTEFKKENILLFPQVRIKNLQATKAA